jgi:hypothetical protein
VVSVGESGMVIPSGTEMGNGTGSRSVRVRERGREYHASSRELGTREIATQMWTFPERRPGYLQCLHRPQHLVLGRTVHEYRYQCESYEKQESKRTLTWATAS